MRIMLDIIFALVENTLIVMYLNLFLKKKKKYENKIILDIVFIIFLSVVLLFIDYFIRIMTNGFVLLIILMIYTNFIYEGSYYNKILKIFLININMILIGGICVFILSNESLYRLMYINDYISYNLAFFIKFIWFIEYLYLKKYYTGEFKLSKRVWAYIVIVLLLMIGLIVIITNELLLAHISLMTALYAYVVSLLVVILIYYVCLKMTEYYNEVINQKINLESLKYENTIVQMATQKSEEYNKILHDYKHLIGVLKDMKGNEKVKQEILEGIDLKETGELIHTNNVVFNYVMNQTITKAYESNIDFHGTYPENISEGITSYDLLILLTNLFDNAIEASRLADKKEIRYKILCNEYDFVIRIENTFNENYFNDFKTIKEDKSKHGQGLNKIKEIVDKYDGEDILQKNDSFVLHSCLINLHN